MNVRALVRKVLPTIVVAGGAIAVTVAIAGNSATATFADPVGKVEMDAYIQRWQDEVTFPGAVPTPTGDLKCGTDQRPTCGVPGVRFCRPPGVRPDVNWVRAAVAVVRVATVLYAAYKAQAGEPADYPLSYFSVSNQLEGTLDSTAVRTDWVNWVNANPNRLNELRRVYQEIPTTQILLRAKYRELIDPQNQLSLTTQWVATPL